VPTLSKRPGPFLIRGAFWVGCYFLTVTSGRSGRAVNDFGPGGYEIFGELRWGVGGGVNFGQGAELGVGTEEEIDSGAGPFQFACLMVLSFESACYVIYSGK
jgi:hypothetical protein